jgi:hypothetical protein
MEMNERRKGRKVIRRGSRMKNYEKQSERSQREENV